MKTSHEMTVSVLRKRDRILRRRRILTTSIGALAGTAAVAAALLITLNVTRPRGVDLIDPGTVSQPVGASTAEINPTADAEEPQYLYNDAAIREDGATGSPGSYSELVDYLETYRGNMNLYEFTITNQYTPDEAVELTGLDIFRSSSTLFSAHIVYDCLNNVEADMDILLAQAGTAESQVANSPLYGLGDLYIAFFPGFDPDSWNVACPELLFAVRSGSECLHINAPKILFESAEGVPLGVEIPENEQYVLTTTSNNPVRYVRKYDVAELSDFLRNDWNSRGLWTDTAADSTNYSPQDMSALIAENWLETWEQRSAAMEMSLPQASVFGFELKDGSRLAAIVFPTYKTNTAVFYRVTDSGFAEIGELGCGWQFKLLENSTEQYLHIMTKYPGPAADSDSLEVDDAYYRITETALEPVFRAGRNIRGDKACDWFVYENDEPVHISGEEYEQQKTAALNYSTVVSTADLDRDGDYQNDEYCAFEDDPEGLKAAVLAAL